MLPIVIHTGRKAWSIPTLASLFPQYQKLSACFPLFEISELDLATVSEDRLTKSSSVLGYLLALFRAQYFSARQYCRALSKVLGGLKSCAKDEEQLKSLVWFCVQLNHHRRPREEWDNMKDVISDFVSEQEGQAMIETIADKFRQEGREQGLKEGLKEGREEGRLLGQRELLLKLLKKRFPERSLEEIQDRLQPLKEMARLNELSERLLENRSWDEIWSSDSTA